jgi:hypothetical protein
MQPTFYVDPLAEQNFARMLRCGEQLAAAQALNLSTSTRAMLRNPIVNDLRGGLGAEVLLCRSALTHPWRTTDPDAADVVLMCPYMLYGFVVDSNPQLPAVLMVR